MYPKARIIHLTLQATMFPPVQSFLINMLIFTPLKINLWEEQMKLKITRSSPASNHM